MFLSVLSVKLMPSLSALALAHTAINVGKQTPQYADFLGTILPYFRWGQHQKEGQKKGEKGRRRRRAKIRTACVWHCFPLFFCQTMNKAITRGTPEKFHFTDLVMCVVSLFFVLLQLPCCIWKLEGISIVEKQLVRLFFCHSFSGPVREQDLGQSLRPW